MARQHRYRGRPPDGTFRSKARPDGSQGKELRLWLTPMTLGEDRVFVGQVSYQMSGASGAAAADYRVDPDIDDARANLLQGFWYGQSLQRISFAKGRGGLDHRCAAREFLRVGVFHRWAARGDLAIRGTHCDERGATGDLGAFARRAGIDR